MRVHLIVLLNIVDLVTCHVFNLLLTLNGRELLIVLIMLNHVSIFIHQRLIVIVDRIFHVILSVHLVVTNLLLLVRLLLQRHNHLLVLQQALQLFLVELVQVVVRQDRHVDQLLVS